MANRIQYLRKTNGVPQEGPADQLGVSRQAVSKWESGQSTPGLDKVILLSEYFDVTTDCLLKGMEKPQQTGQDADKRVDANIFVTVSTALHVIGLLAASAVWYEEQVPMAVAIGLIFMALGIWHWHGGSG